MISTFQSERSDLILKIIDKIIAAIADPTVLILFTIIAVLFFMIWHKDRCIQKLSNDHHNELDMVSKSIVDQISLLTTSIEKQITLLEFIIYKKDESR